MRRFILAVAVLALVATPLFAQQQYGSVTGTVMDAQQAALPGVTVTLGGPAMQGSRTAVTDANGKYRFVPVPPGEGFMITFELSGFNTLENSGVTVNVGRDSVIDAEMSLSQFAETITVTADRIVVDTTKSTVDTTVEWELVDNLATTRNFQSMMQMAPGVQSGNNPATNGGSNDGNLYMVDGVDTTDPRTQTWGSMINWDTIAEAQLQTAGFSAEYGRATGGILNLVTKSGGNQFSFTGRLVKSKAEWSALNGIDSETGRNKSGGSRTDEERPSFTLGGPILKDALWFYTAYEERGNSRGYSRYMSLQDKLDGNLTDGRTSYAGHYFSGKLTWQVNPSHSLVAFYNEDPITLSPLRAGWYNANYSVDTEQLQFQGGDNSSLQWTGVLTPSFFMEAKYQYHRQELNVSPDGRPWSDGVPYIYEYYYNYRTGAPLSEYTSNRDRDGLILAGSYYLDTGASSHQIKGGIEYLGLNPKSGTVYNPAGDYYMWAGEPWFKWLWLDQSGPTEKKQDYYALYVQDSWRMGNLTLNLGLRAESTEIFSNTNQSLLKFGFTDQIAPRLGFAYDLNGDAIRGSIGRFYSLASNYIADYFAVTTDHRQEWDWNFTCDYTTGNVWEFGDECWDLYSDIPTGAGGTTLDPNLDPVYVDELTLGYDKRLNDQMAAGVTFVWRQQDEAIDWYDPEWSGYYYITNVPSGAKSWPGTGSAIANQKWSEYQALQFSLKKRFGPDGFQFIANYTYALKDNSWASNWRDVGAFVFTSGDAMNPLWYGRSDSKHLVKFNGSYTMPWNTVIGITASWTDGDVYTKTTAGDESAIPLTRRGALKIGSSYEADLYIEQPVTIGPVTMALYANIFNALNNQKVTGRQGNSDLSTYSQPNAWSNPRSVQLGFKIEY